MPNTFRSISWSVIGIIVSGFAGGVSGWAVVGAFDLSGVGSALVAAIVGMVVATSVWLVLTVILRKAGIVR